jgi:hypothetical protein
MQTFFQKLLGSQNTFGAISRGFLLTENHENLHTISGEFYRADA